MNRAVIKRGLLAPLARTPSIAFLAVPLVACAAANVDDPPPPDPHEGLSLTAATPDELEGSFTREGISVRFSSIHSASGDTFLLTGTNGRTLVDARTTAEGKQMLVMDGAATFTAASSYRASAKADQGIADLIRSPEGGILPWLSWDLGALGITGRDYPSSFMIHSFAITMAQVHDITLPPMPEKAETKIAPQDNYGGNGAWCQAYSDAWGSNCYGMCGKGCSCWHWVCGDCCNHYGCAHHDAACRSCSIWNPGACASCASFSAFFSGGGCAHP